MTNLFRMASGRHRRCRPIGFVVGMALALAIGTAAQAQTQSNNSTLSLDSAGSSLSLKPITVTSSTASGYAIDPQHAPASVSVVTQEELQGKAYRDVQQALRDIPGVFLNSSPTGKGGTGEIRMRGMGSKYTLLMVDGIPLDASQAYYNGYGQGAKYSWLPPVSAIERIEVIRGPMSTIYGSAALGGVINIITKPVADEWGGTFSAGTTIQENQDSGNIYQSNFRVSGPLIENVLGLRLNAGVHNREEDNFADGYPNYLRRNIGLGLDWAVNDNNELTFEFGFGRQDTNGDPEESGETDFRTERTRQTIRHELDWNERWTTTSYIQRAEVTQSDSGNQSAYERITANTETVIPFNNQVLTIGSQYRLQHIDHDAQRALGQETLERWDGALYAEHEWFLTDNFTLTTGLRAVYDEKYSSELVPRIYGVYDITQTLALKGGVSAGYRTPNLKQSDSNWLEGGCGPRNANCRDVGNSNLEPENSTTYEIGLYYQANNGLSSSLTVFHTEFTNKIDKVAICATEPNAPTCFYQGLGGFNQVNQYQNVGEAQVDGVEVALHVPMTHDLSVDVSYTYTDSEITSGEHAGSPLNDQPEHLATIGLDWQASDASEFWLQARYQSETRSTYGRRGPTDIYPDYAMVDVGASHQLTDQFTIYGGVYNLLDKDIADEEFGRYLDGRRYNIGVRYSF